MQIEFNQDEVEKVMQDVLCSGALTLWEDRHGLIVAKLGSSIGRAPKAKHGWLGAVDVAVRSLAVAILTQRFTGQTPKENSVSYQYH